MGNLRPLSLEVYKLKKTDQRRKILWIPWLFLLKDPSEEQT